MSTTAPNSERHGKALEPQTIGEALSLLRRRADMTRGEAAASAKIAKSTLARYETDEVTHPSIVHLRALVLTYSGRIMTDPDAVMLELVHVVDRFFAEARALDEEADTLTE